MHIDSERWVGKYPRGKFFQAICSPDSDQYPPSGPWVGDTNKEEKEKFRWREDGVLDRDRTRSGEGGGVTRATSHRAAPSAAILDTSKTSARKQFLYLHTPTFHAIVAITTPSTSSSSEEWEICARDQTSLCR